MKDRHISILSKKAGPGLYGLFYGIDEDLRGHYRIVSESELDSIISSMRGDK